MLKIKIAPSILGADYGDLNRYLKKLAPFSDMFHVDVMDGNFVNNLTLGPCVVEAIETKVPLDCHLMINHPEQFIDAFAKAGAASITIHLEASSNPARDIQLIKDAGCKAAISINPATPVFKLIPYLSLVDMVLIMSVVPGWGGQMFIPDVLDKVKFIRERQPELDIQIDGGINDKTAVMAAKAGANVFVAGSYILKAKDPKKAAQSLKAAAQRAF
jgi:ribulose-phosphate 3-epimerase